MAFGSTYARELAFDDAEWNKRAARLSSAPDAATFLAFEGEDCCGIIGGFLAMESATDVMVVSMWVAPHARRKGVAARLMQALESWAREIGRSQLVLEVVKNNAGAIAFYEKCGFYYTGQTVQYPNDPSLRELCMVKSLIRS